MTFLLSDPTAESIDECFLAYINENDKELPEVLLLNRASFYRLTTTGNEREKKEMYQSENVTFIKRSPLYPGHTCEVIVAPFLKDGEIRLYRK